MRFAPFILAALPLLGGCVGTVANVVTAPVRVVGKGVDMVTTSQSERDEKRGRELRKLEERYGKLSREYVKQDKRCSEGKAEACDKRAEIAAEMDAIRPQLPGQLED